MGGLTGLWVVSSFTANRKVEAEQFLSEILALSKFQKMSCKANRLANKNFIKLSINFSVQDTSKFLRESGFYNLLQIKGILKYITLRKMLNIKHFS